MSSEKNDTKIIWFGSVVLILQPFLKTQSFTNFVKSARAIYGRYSCLYMSIRSLFVLFALGFRATMYGGQKSHYPRLKCHENEEKIIENDYVLRNYHRIKTTQPISMILVSSFTEDNVLSDGEKKKSIFLNIKVTKIERSAFGGTPGIPQWFHAIKIIFHAS